MENIESRTEEYQRELEESDAADEKAGRQDTGNDKVLREKMEKLKKCRKENRETEDRMERSGDTQVSTVDEDVGLLRKQGGGHLFGTLKVGNGFHQFPIRGFEKCRGEFSLMTLTYNLTRVLNIPGVEKFREYCAGRRVHSPQTA